MTAFSNTLDIIDAIKTVWQTDEDINNFCAEYYGIRPSVFIGMDDNNPPSRDFYPLVAALEFRIRGGGSSGRYIYDIVMGCGVNDDNIATDAPNRTYTYQGVLRSEQLRSLAFAALVKNNFGKITVKGDTGQASVFPLFISGMTVEIETINSRRRT